MLVSLQAMGVWIAQGADDNSGRCHGVGRDCSDQFGPALDPSLRVTHCSAVICKAVLKHLQTGIASMEVILVLRVNRKL